MRHRRAGIRGFGFRAACPRVPGARCERRELTSCHARARFTQRPVTSAIAPELAARACTRPSRPPSSGLRRRAAKSQSAQWGRFLRPLDRRFHAWSKLAPALRLCEPYADRGKRDRHGARSYAGRRCPSAPSCCHLRCHPPLLRTTAGSLRKCESKCVCRTFGRCRRRDSNPRHADYDSAALTD
jgi:hypothetical protein